MHIQKRPHWRDDFTVAEHAFKEWRAARKKGARIPHDLWRLALDLAKRHSVAKMAVTLGLDYYSFLQDPPRRPHRRPLYEFDPHHRTLRRRNCRLTPTTPLLAP